MLKTLPLTLVKLIHRGYKLLLSPLLGERCRFYPFCSDYLVQAMEAHGLFKGGLLGIKRICKCHPYCEGGFDPVPVKTNRTKI